VDNGAMVPPVAGKRNKAQIPDFGSASGRSLDLVAAPVPPINKMGLLNSLWKNC
jgi:hypothetical protein